MAIVLTAIHWHIVYKFVLVWYPFVCLQSTVLLDSSLLPFLWVWESTTLYIPYTFSVLMMWWCDPSNTVDVFGHVVKKVAQTLCILGCPWETRVLDCKQSVFPLMSCLCCSSLFLCDMVLHQWCPMFRDNVVVLSSGVLYAGHFWHQNGSTVFVTVFLFNCISLTNLWNGVLHWRQFTSPVRCKLKSPNSSLSFHVLQNHAWEPNLICDTQLLIVKKLWVHIDWCLGEHQSQYE